MHGRRPGQRRPEERRTAPAGRPSITLGLAGNVDCTFSNTFTKQNPSVTTDIHNADHQTITSAPIGSTVHDKATVSGVQGFAAPTGDVEFTLFMGSTDCKGGGVDGAPVALSGGVAHPSEDATVPVGGLSYQAHYLGDDTYNDAYGPCEPLPGTKLDSTTRDGRAQRGSRRDHARSDRLDGA